MATVSGETVRESVEHGGDAVAVARRVGVSVGELVDLSASLNPYAPDVADVVREVLGEVRRYPDADVATASLADAIGIDVDRLVLTNGGAEAIALVAAEEREGFVVEPEFSLYLRHLDPVSADGDDAELRWRSNPSNPLGRLAAPEAVARVWDEAFLPLATGHWTRGDDASWRLGSLTKLWACPGLRLGYVLAPDPDAAEAIRQRQPRWSVNGIAGAIVEPMLAMTDLPGWAARIGSLRAHFVDTLTDLGFDARPTDVNWVLVRRAGLREALIPQGVLVRDCTSFAMPGTFRVALPTERELDAVVAAFARVAS